MAIEAAKHTPGPWFASSIDDGKSWSVISLSMTTKNTICYIYGNRAQATKPIDARLIAAAPDLLAACNEAFDFLGGVDGASEIRSVLLTAIAKATAA